MQTAQTSGDHNIVVQLEGEGHQVQISVERVRLELTRFSRRHSATRRTPSPLERLSPYSRSSTLRGREDELNALDQFIQTTDRPVSVRVLTGAGGSGKTRLALELCERWTAQGWQAGFATSRELTRFFAQSALRTWGWSHPTLVVIDYASAHAHRLKDWLLELAEREPDRLPPHPLRILLLERQADVAQGWMHDLFNAGGWDDAPLQDLLDPPAPIPLPAITAIEDRTELLNEMLAQFGRPDLRFDAEAVEQQLRARDWRGDPLFLMMAAAHAADTGSLQVLKLGRTDMATRIAQTERDRLTKLAEQHQPSLSPELLRHLAACVTLAQGRDHADLLTLTKAERIALGRTGHGDDADYADLLCDALPDPQTQGAAPILPDLIGEAFVLDHFGHPQRQRSLDADLLRLIQALRTPMAHTLVRCAQDFIHAHLEPDAQPPLSWLHRLVGKAAGHSEVLDDLANGIPLETVVLRKLKLAVQQARYSAQASNPVISNAERARRAGSLGIAHAQMGDHEAAVTVARQAVALQRPLAEEKPDAFLPDLATSLSNLANVLSDLGQREQALSAAEEAVKLYRQLAQQRPDAFLPDLAMSLSNLASVLNDLGQREQALSAAEEAVKLRRQLAQQRPDAFLPNLATSLSNLASVLSNLGQREQALSAAEEAVKLRRQLAQQRPDAFLPDLAPSLNNLASVLSDLGQRERALSAAEEAVKLYRQLAQQRSDAFLPDLAMSLSNLAGVLSALGQHEQALSAAEEAVKLRRQLAQQRPDAFLPNLATSLSNLASVLSNLGQREQALSAAEEAVKLRRQLAQQRPDAFLPDLAPSLNNLASVLSDLGQRERALSAAEEAVKLYRQLAQQRPNAFLPDLAMSLSTLASVLSKLGQREQAHSPPLKKPSSSIANLPSSGPTPLYKTWRLP